MTKEERLAKAAAAQAAARERRIEADAAADRAIAAHLDGTAWPERSRPLSATERSHIFRARGREIREIPWIADPFGRWFRQQSLLQFGLHYCFGPDKMIKRRPSKRMEGFIKALEQTIRFGGNRHVRWPRGKGKSTWLKVAAIWALVCGYRRFVVIVAATKPMAEEATSEIWRFMSEDPEFAADFPEFAIPLADVALTPQRCRVQTYHGLKTHIVENARYSYKRLAALEGKPHTGGILAARGADQAIRGLNIGSMRPDFIFIDDPQTDETAKSPQQVDKIEARIQGAVLGLGETNRTIAAVMASTPIEPDDISERYADPERHPEWLTTTERLVVSFGPEDWITRYLAEVARDNLAQDVLLTRSRQFYVEHRAEIEAGAEMMDDQDYDPQLEVSAYQHALNRLHAMKPKAFYSECQMKPTRAQGVFRLEARKVAKRLSGYELGEVPPECDQGVLAYIDVNDVVGLRWEIMAFGKGRVTATLAYGRYPATGTLYPKGTPISAIPAFLAPAMRKVYAAIAAAAFRTQDGSEARVRAMCFDGGWQTDTVAAIVTELNTIGGPAVAWSKGFASTQYSRYHHDKARTTEGLRAAEECHTWATANGQYLAINADYWKEVSQSSFLADPLSPSSSCLYGDDPARHFEYAMEVCAEELVAKSDHPRYGSTWNWKITGPNHFGDTHAGCMAFGAIRGNFDPIVRVTAADIVRASTIRRKVRYVVE